MRVLTQGQRPRKQYTLSGFKGVDYSSSPLDVAKYRAAKMQNFLLEDGTLHKRKGWEQAAQFDGQINGLWPFDDGDKQCVIVHAGTDIYAWDSASGTKTKLTGDISTIADRRSYAVYKNKKLYILCGDYLAYGHFSNSDDGAYELRTVAGDTDTYVPTTSMNRGYMSGDNAYTATVDNVNLLTKYRINEFTLTYGENYYMVDTGYIDSTGDITATLIDSFGVETQVSVASTGDIGVVVTETGRKYGIIYVSTNYTQYVTLRLSFPYSVKRSEQETSLLGAEFQQISDEKAAIMPAMPFTQLILDEAIETEPLARRKYYDDPGIMAKVSLFQNTYILYAKTYTTADSTTEYIGMYDETYFSGDSFQTDTYETHVANSYGTFSAATPNQISLQTTKFGNTGMFYNAEALVEYVSHKDVYYETTDNASQIASCTTGCLFGVDGRNDRLFIGGNPDYPNVCYNTAKNDFTYFPDQQTSTCGEETSEISGFCRLGDGTLAVLKNTRDNNDVSVYYITGSSVSMAEGEEGNTLTYDEFFVKAGSIGESCITAHGTANLSGDPLMVSENGVYGIVLSGNVATDERYARERSRSVNTELLKHDLSDACGIAYKNRYYLAVDGECFVADARYKYTLDADMDDTYNYEWFHYKNIPARVWNVLDGELWFGSDTGGVYRMDSGGWADISRTWAEPGTDGTLTVANGVFTYSEDLAIAVESATYVLADGVKANITAGEAAQTFTLTAAETDAAILTAAALVFVTETPVSAAWYSGILDLGTPLYRKNLWLLSIGLRPMSGAEVQFGYRIRRGKNLSDAVADIVGGEANAYGAETFDFGDVDFKRFSFEANGFMSQYTKRVFERDFVYMQLYFKSDSASDCVITDITAVFTEVRKNLGVG